MLILYYAQYCTKLTILYHAIHTIPYHAILYYTRFEAGQSGKQAKRASAGFGDWLIFDASVVRGPPGER